MFQVINRIGMIFCVVDPDSSIAILDFQLPVDVHMNVTVCSDVDIYVFYSIHVCGNVDTCQSSCRRSLPSRGVEHPKFLKLIQSFIKTQLESPPIYQVS